MNLRGALSNKRWKDQRRTRAQADLVDMRARQVVVEGVQHNVTLDIIHQGIQIGSVQTVALYFENGKRIAILRKSGNDELDALHGRLLKAFYSIEVRT
jgi:hypothetical protein